MEIVTDLHLHSRYSRAVSPSMNLETMKHVALQKGIHLLSLADFTHPKWISEVKEKLKEVREGIYALSEKDSVFFLTATEISCIYKQGGKLRRIHVLVCLSSLEKAELLNKALVQKRANLSADGRPIVGLSAKHLLELMLTIDEKGMLIPAHAWTPHFGVYGSASGFDSLSECFEDLTPFVYGIETGISSDPEMNWQIEELENRSILSFSDAHSLPKMIREATVFQGEAEFTYTDLWQAIKREEGKLQTGFTIEFYPEEGKYHYSGHRNCKVSYSLEDVLKKGTVCPQCTRQLTEGVFIRLSQLAPKLDTSRVVIKEDTQSVKWYTDRKFHHPPFVKLVPLIEIIAEALRQQVKTKRVEQTYQEILTLGTELDILLRVPLSEIEKKMGEKIAEGILKNRKGEISIIPGFDGEYGKISIWKENPPQLGLF